MRLLIHAANLTSGGGLAVGASLLQAWNQVADDRLVVLASPQLARLAPAGMDLRVIEPSPTASLRSLLRFQRYAAAVEREHTAEAVLTVFGPPLWRPAAPHLCGFANGLYLWHPETPARAPESPMRQISRRLRRWQTLRSLRRDADCLWVETALAQEALKKAVGTAKPVAVVANALHAAFEPFRFRPCEPPSIAAPFRLFTPAAGYPHKNFALIRQLLPLFLPGEVEFHLTLTGTEMERQFGASKDHPALVNHGPLAPDVLLARYRAVHAVFTPSLLEIASAAWNEAAAMRRPLVTADIPAARAACGESALYFNRHDATAAAACIRRLRDVEALRVGLVQRGTLRLDAIPTALDRAAALRRLLQNMLRSKTGA